MNYAYIRVSTDRQTVDNQRFEINNFCQDRHIRIDRYIEETVSGMKAVDKRELGTLIKKMKRGDTLIASEISRFGRRLLEVMAILKLLMDKKVNVVTVKEHFELGDNLQSHVIAFAFSLASEIERSLISQRTKEALARRRALGLKLGRKAGGSNARHKLDAHTDLIRTMTEYGYTKAEICRRVGCTYTTLQRHLLRTGLDVASRPLPVAPTVPVPPAVPRCAKNRKVILLPVSDRPAHILRKAEAYRHGHSQPSLTRHHVLHGCEQSILRMLRKGCSKTYIASRLGCNIKTLNAHLIRMGVRLVKE